VLTVTVEDKATLRRYFRAQRRAIGEQRSGHDQAIRSHLAAALSERAVQRIAAYLAFDGEPDLEPLLLDWHARGGSLALPVVPPDRTAVMAMREWVPDEDTDRNVLGIREPRIGRHVALHEIDVLLMPLVAWDLAGNRLGLGAGYYDRYLSTGSGPDRPLRVGVAYTCQQASLLPSDPWDVPLHAVVTEQGWLSCSS